MSPAYQTRRFLTIKFGWNFRNRWLRRRIKDKIIITQWEWRVQEVAFTKFGIYKKSARRRFAAGAWIDRLLNRNGMVLRQLLHHLGQSDLQDAVFKLGRHILGLHTLAYIEAAAALTNIAFPPQIAAVLFLFVLIQPLAALMVR